MSHHIKREHLIGDKRVPYELRCIVHSINNDLNVAVVEVKTPSGYKILTVRADQVYFRLESKN